MVTAADRRTFERIDGIVNVRYGVRGRDRYKIESLPRNIGAGGLGVCMTEELKPGTVLDLEITVPDDPQKIISGVGEVLWTREFGVINSEKSINLYETGIKFINIKPLAVGRVYAYSRHLKK